MKAVVRAEVTLTGGTVSRITQTNDQGRFVFPDLVQGDYRVTAKFGDLSAEQTITVPD